MRPETEMQLKALPIGFHHLHPDANMNFQMNRWLSWGWGADETLQFDMRRAAPRITTHADWIREFRALSETARDRGEEMKAALYARSAEFFMGSGDEQKAAFRKLFVEAVRKAEGISAADIVEVPYAQGAAMLPVLRLGEGGAKGPLLICGGFDSYMEEFIPFARLFAAEGYDVALFEGPGQGAVLEAGVPMTHRWELPVASVLDALGFESAALIGISLGGYLALRAAAFEPRIRAVVAWDVIYNFRDVLLSRLGAVTRIFLRACLALRMHALLDAALGLAMRRNSVVAWGVAQGMRVFGAGTPSGFLRAAGLYSAASFSGELGCDVLLMAGEKDHYVPLGMLRRQERAITGARSLATRLFTEAESAQSHCQVGNVGLAISVMIDWLDKLRAR